MYVIFPADEVVYLSYGRLIYVPNNSNPDIQPIRTSSPPNEAYSVTNSSCSSRPSNANSESYVTSGPTISSNSLEIPSTSRGPNVSVTNESVKVKKKPSRFNFSLLRKSRSNKSETPLTSRVRYSVGAVELPSSSQSKAPPTDAFNKFCSINETPLPKPSTEQPTPNCETKISSKRSSSSSKTSRPTSFQEGRDSKRSSKHSSSSSKSTPKQEKAPLNSSNNSSPKKSPKYLSSNDIIDRPSTSQEVFYPLAISRERTYTDPSLSVVKPAVKSKFSSGSFRLSFRKDKTPEVPPPVPPERKKTKKVSSKFDRKLSYSDFLAISREKTEVKVTKSEEKSIKQDKSPVLGIFRGKSSSPRNLGCDRTPVGIDKLYRTEEDRNIQHQSRLAKRRAHFTHEGRSTLKRATDEVNMASNESALRNLTHPAYNDHLKAHNGVTFKLVRTVSDFTQQLGQMYEQHAEELQMLVANFRKRNGELRKERPACPSSLFHTWEALLQEVEIDSQSLGDVASILGRSVSRPMLERSFHRKIQSRKVFTHREGYETIIAKTEEKLAKCRQEYKNAYLSYLSNPTTESLSAYFNTHNAYVQQLHATNGMMEEFGKETLPSLLEELEEIYTDLCSTVTEAVIQGAEVISTRSVEQSRRYEGLVNQCRAVSSSTDLAHMARTLPVPQGRGPVMKRIFVPPQPPPPQDTVDGEVPDTSLNDNIPPPLKDELIVDRLSAVQIKPSADALRKEADELVAQIRQIQDGLETLVRIQQRAAEASLYNKANELQEDISIKKFDLRVAQIHLSAINSQKELFTSKLEGDTGGGRERKMSAASTGSMKNKWLKAFKSLKTPPPEAEKKNGSAATRELLKGDPDAHSFQEYTYKKITPCDVCSQILRGHTRQGLKCRICKMNVHLDCQNKASKCQTKARLLRRQKSTSEIETRVPEMTVEEERLAPVYSMPTINRRLSIKQNNNRLYPPPVNAIHTDQQHRRHHSQGPSGVQQPPPQDSSSMRRRLFAGMKSLTGFGSRSRQGSPGHRSISLPEKRNSQDASGTRPFGQPLCLGPQINNGNSLELPPKPPSPSPSKGRQTPLKKVPKNKK